jgi:hypothetical protein
MQVHIDYGVHNFWDTDYEMSRASFGNVQLRTLLATFEKRSPGQRAILTAVLSDESYQLQSVRAFQLRSHQAYRHVEVKRSLL